MLFGVMFCLTAFCLAALGILLIPKLSLVIVDMYMTFTRRRRYYVVYVDQ